MPSNQKSNNTIHLLVYTTFALLVIFVYFYPIFSYEKTDLYYPESEKLIFVNQEDSNPLTYSFKLNSLKNGAKMYLMVNSSYLSYQIYSGDEKVYEYLKDEDSFVDSMGYHMSMIKVDDEYLNEEIKIEFKSNLGENQKIRTPEIVAGERALLIGYILKANIIEVLSAFLLFITSVFLIMTALVLSILKLPKKKIIILAMLAFISGLYILMVGNVIRFYFQNSIICYLLNYTMFNLLPLPILLLLLEQVENDKKGKLPIKILQVLSVAVLINIILQWILTILGFAEFRTMRNITYGLFLIIFFMSIYIVFTLDKNNVYKKYIIISVMSVFISAIFTVVFHYNKTYSNYQPYAYIFPIMFVLIVQYIYAVKQYVKQHNTAIQNSFYKELAFCDSLTNLYNSHAFDRDMKELKSKFKRYKTIVVTVIDINNLKYVNDKFGHDMGDQYIKCLSNILLAASEKNQNIYAYRPGGDEFCLVIYDNTLEFSEKIINYVKNEAKKISIADVDIPLYFAYGSEFANISRDFDLGKIVLAADKKMYENKRKMKGENDYEKI